MANVPVTFALSGLKTLISHTMGKYQQQTVDLSKRVVAATISMSLLKDLGKLQDLVAQHAEAAERQVLKETLIDHDLFVAIHFPDKD